MKFLTSASIASLLLSLPVVAQETVSGLILPRDDGGMYLRNVDGEFEIEWHNETAVALEVNTRQLKQLAIDDGGKATAAQIARRNLSELERGNLDDPAELSRQNQPRR